MHLLKNERNHSSCLKIKSLTPTLFLALLCHLSCISFLKQPEQKPKGKKKKKDRFCNSSKSLPNYTAGTTLLTGHEGQSKEGKKPKAIFQSMARTGTTSLSPWDAARRTPGGCACSLAASKAERDSACEDILVKKKALPASPGQYLEAERWPRLRSLPEELG